MCDGYGSKGEGGPQWSRPTFKNLMQNLAQEELGAFMLRIVEEFSR